MTLAGLIVTGIVLAFEPQALPVFAYYGVGFMLLLLVLVVLFVRCEACGFSCSPHLYFQNAKCPKCKKPLAGEDEADE